MSADAEGYVWKHSPYKGATLLVHLALGDIANDAHAYELWVSNERLGKKARVGRNAVIGALATLTADGYLELLAEGGGRGNPARYRFLMPAPKTARSEGSFQTARPRTETARSRAQTARSAGRTHTSNSSELKQRNPAAEAAGELAGMPQAKQSQRATDPLVAEAHSLTERIFANRQPKPLPNFLNVRALAVRAVECGWAPTEVEAAMMRGDTVFTLAGLEVARSKGANENSNGDETTAQQMARLRAEGKIE